MIPIFTAISYTIIAGIMNGSFALPTKHIRQWQFENIWLNYAFWTFLALPWLFAIGLDSHIWLTYQTTPIQTLLVLITGGFFFGIGQICFARSLDKIGFGLSFLINIGFGTSLGVLLPFIVIHPNKIFSTFGLFTLSGLI